MCKAAALPPTGVASTAQAQQVAAQAAKATLLSKGCSLAVKGFGVYGASIAGHVIPKFHEKLIHEKNLKGAVSYLGAAVFKGQLESKSNLAEFDTNVARTIVKMLPLKDRKKIFDELRKEYGPEDAKKIISKLTLSGGGQYFEVDWVKLCNRVYYFYFLWSFFFILIPEFFGYIDAEIQKNPELSNEFYLLYSQYFLPHGYTIGKENCLTTCSIVIDDIFLVNIDIY